MPQPPDVDERVFLVEDVYWVASGANGATPITGSGSYVVGVGERDERMQRMKLELRVGDAEPRLFDSGRVPLPHPRLTPTVASRSPLPAHIHHTRPPGPLGSFRDGKALRWASFPSATSSPPTAVRERTL